MTYPIREDTLLMKRKIEEMHLEGKKVLEIGTGNGLVTITAAEKGAEVTATDVDPGALEEARNRAAERGVSNRIEFVESDLLESVSGKYDFILFNPPYLPGKNRENSTWDGGETGIEKTLNFLEEARDYLMDGGEIFFVASSLADTDTLEERFDLDMVDEENLWFERLYLFRSD